ncbi:MAG: serine/threonine-protein kinase, partial [Pseudomonadota bacterium]
MSDLRLIYENTELAPKPEKAVDMSQTRVIKDPASNTTVGMVTPTFEAGSTLGSYLVVSKLGEGGMGMVYKAHDTTLDRTVALKVLSPHLFRNLEFLQRFRVEAQAQARLNGPNIVTLHSMFEIPGSLVLVMEHVEGHTLDQRLHNEGRLSVATTVWVFEQALLGVERAHRMGIVHRDLKPSNIFITNTHEIKLMDFGVAKILDSKENTQTGSMIGTLMYISPEQITGHDADFRSDIYTLGITLYQAVTGVLPFEKKTDYEYMNAHLHEQPLPPTALQPAIPQELEDIILKAMDKDPDKRFQSAHEFRKALLKVGMVHVRAYRRLKA